ncbi:dTDP-4-dehydrorhamnose reductase [Acetobacter cerevisiae]|uniref:dTDP-4-dehydrorhamnose reductase n=1 Tax=Acetobacter cerevisiae TaxID=178900 RepID=A0A149UX76_9PROT|nr:dTDP-4-dehydrorhamnose reductase [Acetobacter cerevisiae]KXV72519.1 dTDP-4-dehydrorhamnose reductase [Acetobacter cerevisiae]MCP1244958.1 dTDP-4-dehydrorhamnose reductase [Acetobacter cerevisiae]MCP1254535.1 dTDP-4-dehydrorhamnose reductase [Acetobacter cerevisiae]
MSRLAQNGGPILVTGGKGQLATSLVNLGGPRIRCVGRPGFDFDKPETLAATLDAIKPVAVVNAAAWTAVDLAESEPEGAARANTTGPEELARLCAQRGIPLIQVSTDYVFSGDKGAPYVETDPVSPETVYGRTKADGESKTLAANPKTIVLRTSWVYSAHGKNFVRTMLNAGAKNPALKVVGDQKGNPTSSDDLAEAILSILAVLEKDGWKDAFAGIYHACGTGETTWHGLAVAALRDALPHGQKMPEVTAIRTEDWPTPAKRPADSRMDNSKLTRVFGVTMPAWQDSVRKTVDQIFAQSA